MAKKKLVRVGKKIDWRIIVAGLSALTAIEITALCNGIDGTMLMTTFVIIGGVLGITLPINLRTK